MSLKVIILAAGQGTRMQSHLPKVLHALAGKPLLGHVIDTARRLQPEMIIVVHGHGGEQVKQAFSAQEDMSWVLQAQQLGTGHAVQQAVAHIQDNDHILVLYGDVPLIETASLHALLEKVSEQAIALLSVMLDEPKGYGRIIRDSEGHVTAIVEEKDASQVQRAIQEINTGIMAFRGQQLKSLLSGLSTDNAQGEYYLTDTIAAAHRQGIHVHALAAISQSEVMGINDRRQLAQLERIKQMQLSEKLMLQGVTLADPHRLDIRGEVSSGRDVIIDIDVILEGRVIIEEGVYIGPFCYIKDAYIGKDSVIHSHSVIENSHVGRACQIGPYARLRPGTAMQAQAKVGNFVEIKKTTLGKGSKVNHLSYVGDASVGDNVNIGAGTITCNYDGANKHQTSIEDEAFIGSNTALVAPVKIGAGATIGAGSTITKDVPAHSLAVARNKQNINTHWKRPTKRS